MRKLTPTLTQSGLLAVLLQRQRDKSNPVCPASRTPQENARRPLESPITWQYRALTAPTLVGDSAEPFVGTVPRHT